MKILITVMILSISSIWYIDWNTKKLEDCASRNHRNECLTKEQAEKLNKDLEIEKIKFEKKMDELYSNIKR